MTGNISPLAPQPAIVTADLYDDNHEQVEVIDLQFRSFGLRQTFFGSIATLRCFEDHTPVLALLETPGDGRVLVIDAGGSTRIGVMGDRLAEKGVANGWRGVVIHGAIRDSLGIDALDLGVRAIATTARRGWSPNASQSGVPLVIGGVTIREGQWAYADRDSVIIAPRELTLV